MKPATSDTTIGDCPMPRNSKVLSTTPVRPAQRDRLRSTPSFTVTSIVNEAGEKDFPWFWTSTTHNSSSRESGRAAVYIAFGRAMGKMHGIWMDVHGAGAQRSDPKTGSPSRWRNGRGPQGDAIRIYNFARPVRDAGR